MNAIRNTFAKWAPIDAHYVDPEALRLSSFYFAAGFHRRPEKPRIRVTVPAPLSTREPALTGD